MVILCDLLIQMDRSVDSSWKYFLTYIHSAFLLIFWLRASQNILNQQSLQNNFHLTLWRTCSLLWDQPPNKIAGRNGFASGCGGGRGNSLEGNRVKKINNSKNLFSFSPTPPKFALTPVYPSCGNDLPYHSANWGHSFS